MNLLPLDFFLFLKFHCYIVILHELYALQFLLILINLHNNKRLKRFIIYNNSNIIGQDDLFFMLIAIKIIKFNLKHRMYK